MTFLRFLALYMSCIWLPAQQYILETPLDHLVNETSGLIYLNNTLITHNDSGNSNELFEIDLISGNISRTITISNATNIDWEDIAYDNNYIYIGDFGNFDATRTDLRVYRILRSEFFNSNSVMADIIHFSYEDQTDFSVQEFTTNFDAEALIHFNNNLYIFTKNWADGNTNIYQLPKIPGTYSISILDVVNSQGLVTGATTSIDESSVVLCGYNINGSFVIELSGFSSGLFSNGSLTKVYVSPPVGYSFQTEGIAPFNVNEYYVSAEEANGNSQGLFSVNLQTLNLNSAQDNSISFYPNPANSTIKLSTDQYDTSIYSITGQLIKSYSTSILNISDISNGLYIIKFKPKTDFGYNLSKRLVIER